MSWIAPIVALWVGFMLGVGLMCLFAMAKADG